MILPYNSYTLQPQEINGLYISSALAQANGQAQRSSQMLLSSRAQM